MATTRRSKVSFRATRHISRPMRVKFYTSTGKEVSFKATKKIKVPTRVEFYTHPKSKGSKRKK